MTEISNWIAINIIAPLTLPIFVMFVLGCMTDQKVEPAVKSYLSVLAKVFAGIWLTALFFISIPWRLFLHYHPAIAAKLVDLGYKLPINDTFAAAKDTKDDQPSKEDHQSKPGKRRIDRPTYTVGDRRIER